ncbi:MAG: hypothetical protein WCO05_02340 [Candidatus Moraniibacteriota bacterium]|jgi:hypothetical protein
MWNPFKKNTGTSDDQNAGVAKAASVKVDDKKKEDDSPKMNMLQRLAMKRMERMSPQEKAKMMQEVLKPENKDKLLGAMEMMRKSGQITQEQYDMAKQKMDI